MSGSDKDDSEVVYDGPFRVNLADLKRENENQDRMDRQMMSSNSSQMPSSPPQGYGHPQQYAQGAYGYDYHRHDPYFDPRYDSNSMRISASFNVSAGYGYQAGHGHGHGHNHGGYAVQRGNYGTYYGPSPAPEKIGHVPEPEQRISNLERQYGHDSIPSVVPRMPFGYGH